VQHALAVGLPQDIVDGIAAGGAAALPHPFGLLRDVLTKDLAWQPIPRRCRRKPPPNGARMAWSRS